MPSLRSFLFKGLIVAVINALCKVVTNDGLNHQSMKNLTIFLAINKNLKNLTFTKNGDFVYLDTVLLFSYIILRV